MGHNSSKNAPEGVFPFGRHQHSASCHERKLVEKQDFVHFICELKKILKETEVESSLQVKGNENKQGNSGFGGQRILSYSVTMNSKEQHLVYIRCNCPGQYVGMDINKLDIRGQTALHVAIRKKDHRITELLLESGAQRHKHNKWGLTPLHAACEIGDSDIVIKLLSMGADPGSKEQQSLSMFSNQCRTPLIIASSHGHVHCLAAILDAGAETSSCDFGGNTALHKACVYGHLACVRLLLSHGANPDARNFLGATPLQLALMQRHSDIVRLLLAADCDVKTYTNDLPSVLTLSATMGEYGVLKKCIDSNQDIDVPDKFKRTPLYYTFTSDVRMLRTNYTAISTQGVSFDIQYSQLNHRKDTFDLLIQEGANVEQIMCQAFKSNALTTKHFTLPQNVELFRISISACGFSKVPERELEALLWRLIGSSSGILIRKLLQAVPSLDRYVKHKLRDVTDWTGAHTDDAVVRYLENAGANTYDAKWMNRLLKNPRTLQEWCRQSIRKQVSRNVLYCAPLLPLPHMLQDFIMLKETPNSGQSIEYLWSV